LLYDALQMSFREFKVRRNPKCPVCGDEPTITKLIDYEQFCGMRGQETPAPVAAGGADITVEGLKQRRRRGEEGFSRGERHSVEIQICRIAGSTVIPLPQLPQRLGELERAHEIIVHCKSGVRSQKAIQFLRQQGFTRLKNLTGGILAWADRIDKNMLKY